MGDWGESVCCGCGRVFIRKVGSAGRYCAYDCYAGFTRTKSRAFNTSPISQALWHHVELLVREESPPWFTDEQYVDAVCRVFADLRDERARFPVPTALISDAVEKVKAMSATRFRELSLETPVANSRGESTPQTLGQRLGVF